MTKKHFDFVSDVLYDYSIEYVVDQDQYEQLCNHFAHTLAQTNPLFKRDLFLKACGVADGAEITDSRAAG